MGDTPRIILFDLETIPNLQETFEHFPRLGDYPGLTLKASINSVICAGWKVYGEKRVSCINAWDFEKSWEKNINNDYYLVSEIHSILKKADVVVTHNGKRFDWKFLQTRLMYHKLPPLPDIIHIDTCMEARKHLLMFNNRLNTVAKYLTNFEKMENDGWKLWVDVYARKRAAMTKMEAYCKQDVVVLEKVFKRLRPLIKGLPSLRLFGGKGCVKCGSQRIKKDGRRITRTCVRQEYQCQKCGSYFSEKLAGP